MASPPKFKMVPVSNNARNIDAMVALGNAAFAHSPMNRAILLRPDDPASMAVHNEFRRKRITRHLAGEGGPPGAAERFRSFYAKMVVEEADLPDLPDDEKRVAALAGFHGPLLDRGEDERKEKTGSDGGDGGAGGTEDKSAVPAVANTATFIDEPTTNSTTAATATAATEDPTTAAEAGLPAPPADPAQIVNMPLVQFIDSKIAELSEIYIMPDCNEHLWYLRTLATHPDFQRRGLGGRLMEWGLDLAEKDARRHNAEIDEMEKNGSGGSDSKGRGKKRIRGCYCVASPEGLKTYLNAGMREAGSYTLDVRNFGVREEDPERAMEKYVWMVRWFEGEEYRRPDVGEKEKEEEKQGK